MDERGNGHTRFIVALFLTALGAAAFAVTFRLSLNLVYRVLYGAQSVVEAIASLPAWLRLAIPTGGAAVAGLLSRWRLSRTQGVSNVMEAVALGKMKLSLRVTAWRVAGSWSAIATGLSIGREGPLIEFGGSLGSRVARLFGSR